MDNLTCTLDRQAGESESAEFMRIGRLKFELLASGLCISSPALRWLSDAKGPLRTRSGSSGGLDIVLPFDIHVNAPTMESFAKHSALVLDEVDEHLVLRREEETLTAVEILPEPAFYSQVLCDGTPMVRIGQMCSGDRFCYGMTGPYCWFWKHERRCKYCSIGLNAPADASSKQAAQLLEALAMAANDPILPARHVLLGGGTPVGEDMGSLLASELCRGIKEVTSLSVYVMICAPLKDHYIDMLHDAGVDELGMNLEFFSDNAWARFIPGKHRHIGKGRYLDALTHAVSVFGPINTRSILMVGLEPPESTIDGAELLASMGVMPILSPFRPLTGTELAHWCGFDATMYWEIFQEVRTRTERYGMPIGPTCIACQNNTLALPLPGPHFRCY